jgi:hypothetical protein
MIQTFGNLERFVAGGHTLTDSCYASPVALINAGFGKGLKSRCAKWYDNTIFLALQASWSFECIFKQRNSQTLLPPPTINSIILTLTTRETFQARYITLNTDRPCCS